jgi:hypothetical protein
LILPLGLTVRLRMVGCRETPSYYEVVVKRRLELASKKAASVANKVLQHPYNRDNTLVEQFS